MNIKKSILLNPLVARGHTKEHRASTPLELFYDLIYVVAIASLATQLHHALSLGHHNIYYSIGMFFFVFWTIWWPWNAYTWFASGYDTNDAQFRLASFAQMVGVMIIAVGVKPAFYENNFYIMMIGYITMRIPYILMWLKVAHDDSDTRKLALFYAFNVFVLQLAWCVCVLYYQNWYFFIVLALLEMFMPYVTDKYVGQSKHARYNYHHIEERLGLLLIIVLGESILSSVYGMHIIIESYSPELLKHIVAGIFIFFSMWWLYFDDPLREKLKDEKISYVWAYCHYFIYIGATGVGVMFSVNADILSLQAKLPMPLSMVLLGVSLAVFLLALWVVHDLWSEKKGLQRYELLILASFILGISFFMPNILVISAAFVLLNILRVYRQHKEC